MHSWMLQGLAVGCLLTAATAVAQKETSNAAAGSTVAAGKPHAEHTGGSPSESTSTRLPSKVRGPRMNESKAGNHVTVGGQVQSPGPVPIGTSSTLASVIERAGGATPFGAMNRVRVTRGKHVSEYDLRTAEGRAFRVECKDTIEVPQKMVVGN